MKFRTMPDQELIDAFNKDVGNPGWVAARGRFHAAMREEFIRRGFDFSEINNDESLSFKSKIFLVGKFVHRRPKFIKNYLGVNARKKIIIQDEFDAKIKAAMDRGYSRKRALEYVDNFYEVEELDRE